MTVSQTLADFAAGLRLEEVPAAVSERARYLALDALGVALASSRKDFARIALNGVQAMGDTGTNEVVGMGAGLTLRDAILMNGLLVHGLDYDDTYLPGSIHLCATNVPAAFGVAAQRHASGRELLAALVVGLEAGARIAQAGLGNIHKAGFHPTSVCGAFSSSLVAGRLMGLNTKQLTLAQGIALATASGTVQPMQDGTWTKRFHPGWAAASGVVAAHMAQAGYTGPSLAYEGPMGFYNAFLGALAKEARPAMVGAQLGERWEFPTASIKLYPACHHMHAFVNAARDIREQMVGSLRAEDIESVHALVASVAVPLVCEPAAEKYAPATDYIAQFSLQFSIACGLLRGAFGLGELEPAVRTDPSLVALARKVTYEVDPASGFPKSRTGEVIVRLRDGRVLRARNEILPQEPASNEEIVAKFMENARTAVAPAKAAELCELLIGLEQQKDAAVLMQALGRATPAPGHSA
ncbi:MmgE/PrpD family protein [Caenimonas aquaedulcis]|uniref:MmgE/PrpD family protein n=1 Tax=Caenimonas aquaedulcis TaxID=2793270 RepID=A0A931H0Q3_9BURK|nr:MmgE/PrpD family protein [Caenimonas aquaedulcis]MBG9386400.1 MmgE/PrpD family protein [Caenimonas aquaedulcis]